MTAFPLDKIDVATRRWSLTDLVQIAETATSWVFKARQAHRATALKVLKPYGADEIHGAELMVWYAGIGAAQIIEIHDEMILMEWLDGSLLGDMAREGRDTEAAEILCQVARDLHRYRATALPELEDLALRFRTLTTSRLDDWPLSHREHFRRATEIAQTLIETTTTRIPLHGDFHHDNVVHSERGWLAIDPKGLIGDPAYEFGNVFRNPRGCNDAASNPERIDRVASQFAAGLGLDRSRILNWAAAHSAISACWDRAAGNSYDWDLTMLPLLLAAASR